MDKKHLDKILESVASGGISVESAAEQLKKLSFETMDYAQVDHHRTLRKGFPEVIYGEGKTAGQIIGIMEKILSQETVVMATRVDKEKAEKIIPVFPDAEYHEDAGMIIIEKEGIPIKGKGTILIVTAGTSDLPVAKEAYLTAKTMGNSTEAVFDVGVAGIHRLFKHKDLIDNASVIIAVAGMEGALPSVVAGMVACPVIAVPTSVGYGSAFGGLTALFAMLNSCSSNVAVVNIDNGFGAGYMASSINRSSN